MAIQAVVFDAFDTLFLNTRDLWRDCFARICRDQGLATDPNTLYDAWAISETDFRHGRNDIDTMKASAPFQTYSEVWHDALSELSARLESLETRTPPWGTSSRTWEGGLPSPRH